MAKKRGTLLMDVPYVSINQNKSKLLIYLFMTFSIYIYSDKSYVRQNVNVLFA